MAIGEYVKDILLKHRKKKAAGNGLRELFAGGLSDLETEEDNVACQYPFTLIFLKKFNF